MTARAAASPATIVLVHGAWHGAWAWGDVVPRLTARGLDVRAIDLPGRGRGPGGHRLADHVAFLRRELESIDGPVVICSHSYGGAVAGEAAHGIPGVAHLVFVAAFMLEPGESCADANQPVPAPVPGPGIVERDGYMEVAEESATALFFHDCAPAEARDAVARLTPEHTHTTRIPVGRAAWHDVSSTYVVCADDRALSPAAQLAMAERAGTRITVRSGHSIALTRPGLIADGLARVAAQGGRGSWS